MPTVLITPEALLDKPGQHVDMLQDAGFDIRYPQHPQFTRGLGTEQETIDELRGAVADIAGGERFTANVLSALPDLKVIARAGVGFDRVDIPAATQQGIAVTVTPTANHQAVAEQTMTLLLSVAKSVVVHDADVRAGRWIQAPTKAVRGSTLGIFGLGRIGKSTAVRAAGMGMTVIATELYPDEEFVRKHNIELVDFDTLLARSDYITIHCPLNDDTRGMFNKDVFARMKPGGVIINTSRGGVIAEAELIDALKSGTLRAAGLDVFEQEPPSPDNPLFELDNVVLSPHFAGADELSIVDMAVEAADCIIKLSRGEWPDGAVVNQELKERWSP